MGTQSFTHPYSPFRVLIWMVLALLSAPQTNAQANATSVPLILPSAVAFDSSGNLYIAETGKHVIRKVDSQGHITTVAGTGTQGFSGDSGLASLAQLDSPQGLALAGNTLFIADTHNHRIRVIDLATNVITTVAGGAVGFGGDAGPATKAHLNLPIALALDLVGNLYLTDTANHRIRRIDVATGIISTVAGNSTQGYSGDDSPALSASIDSPSGLAVDSSGNLYLADAHNNRIRKIDAAKGIITTLAGGGSTPLGLPQGITLDAAGNLYVADSVNHRIVRIGANTSSLTVVAGTAIQGFSGDSGPAIAANLDSPRAVALSPTGQLTLSDTHNQRIRQIGSQSIDTIAGLGNSTPGSLTLSAPSILTYGTGQLTAVLTGSLPATGSITIFDTYLSATSVLAILPVSTNSSTLALDNLPVGTHTLAATYPGDSTHPSARSLTLSLTITPAATLTTLSLSSLSTQPITVTAKVVSTTSGTPTGTVSLQAGVPVGSAALTPSGAASAILPTLGPGTYTLTASYPGDHNFQPSSSTPTTLTIDPLTTPAADFTLIASTPTAQTVPTGTSATYTFITQTLGALSSPITLTAAGLPLGGTATFSPTYLPPGTSTNTFSLTITTLKPALKNPAAILFPTALGTILLSLLQRKSRRQSQLCCRRLPALLSLVLLSWITLATTACGDRIASGSQADTQPVSYPITVTATATGPTGAPLVHSATVNLTLQ